VAVMDIVLRRARADESDALAALFRRSRTTAMPDLLPLHTPDEDRAYFRERVLASYDVWIAERGGEVAGFCATAPGWIEHLYVDPAHQRVGVGSALLRRAISVESSLALWTFRRNVNACRFYEAHGFRVARTTEGDNEEREPDVLYVWAPDSRRRDRANRITSKRPP
jgi:putative acetyltransferase